MIKTAIHLSRSILCLGSFHKLFSILLKLYHECVVGQHVNKVNEQVKYNPTTTSILSQLLCRLSSTFRYKVIDSFFHCFFIKVTSEDTVTKSTLEQYQAQISVLYLFVHTH